MQVIPVQIESFRNVIDFRTYTGMFPFWSEGEIVAFIDLYKIDDPYQKIKIEKLSDLMKNSFNQALHD